MNELERVKDFVKDYQELCMKHKLYIGQYYESQVIKNLDNPRDIESFDADINGIRMDNWIYGDEWRIHDDE